MRRLTTWLSAVAMLLATVMAIALPGTSLAHEEGTFAGHPLVGTWLIAEAEAPDDPFMASFSADGMAIQIEGAGAAVLGVWEPTGPATANLTFRMRLEEEGFEGVITIRATFDVAPDGLSLAGEYTAQIMTADDDAGELGPGAVAGNRMVVEPMGTPVGPLFEEDEGEEATPAG